MDSRLVNLVVINWTYLMIKTSLFQKKINYVLVTKNVCTFKYS